MKLAVVHCRVAPGGALNVLEDLILQEKEKEKYKSEQIHIFTMHSTQTTLDNIRITSAIPKWLHRIDHRLRMPFYPIIMKYLSYKIKKYNPDNILISSFAIAKNIYCTRRDAINRVSPKTTLYLHSPMQYIWSHYDEYINKFSGIKKIIYKFVSRYLRKRDLKFTKYREVIANSNYTKDLAKKIYGISAKVSYPKVDKVFFEQVVVENPSDYYVYSGRIVKFVKEVDVIIKLFNKIGKKLIIIGSGPDEKELKNLANNNIVFTGRGPKNMIEIIKNAKGFINITKESFGLSTASALLLGVPVFGYSQGATPELVDEKSGILVENKTQKHLEEKFKIFESTNRDRKYISDNIKKAHQQ